MAVVLNWFNGGGLEVVVLKGGCAFWVLEIGAIARASHLLHCAVFYCFDFRFRFGRLCFALCFIGRLFCSLLCHTRLDRVSCFVSLMVWMVYLK